MDDREIRHVATTRFFLEPDLRRCVTNYQKITLLPEKKGGGGKTKKKRNENSLLL